MDSTATDKPTDYYIDFENVHGPGLKGIDELREEDAVFVFYSQAAETFHIEQAIDIMKSKARIEFVEIDGGTRNSLDFQLVAALFGTMDEGREYAIVSGDGGFDAAIRMGERLELPRVRRITDLTGSTESPQAKPSRSRRSRSRKSADAQEKPETPKRDDAPDAPDAPATSTAPAASGGDAGDNGTRKAKVTQKLPAAKPQRQLPSPAADDAQGEKQATSDTPDSAPAKSGRYSKRKEIKAMLSGNGVTLNQQQLSSVMKALNGVKNKQGFYRAIIQAEKQERGLELYRQVRDHYEAMVTILHA